MGTVLNEFNQIQSSVPSQRRNQWELLRTSSTRFHSLLKTSLVNPWELLKESSTRFNSSSLRDGHCSRKNMTSAKSTNAN